MSTLTHQHREHKPISGSAKWIRKPETVNGAGVVEITSITKRGPVTALYHLEPIFRGADRVGWKLSNTKNGKHYDINTENEKHPTCECGDWSWRREPSDDPKGCKHIAALRVLLARLEAEPVEESKPEEIAEPQPAQKPYRVEPVMRCDAPSARFDSAVEAERWANRTSRKEKVDYAMTFVFSNGRSRKLGTVRHQ